MNTRSGSAKSLSEASDNSLALEESEFFRKQLVDKEKQLRAQARALDIKEMELNKKLNESVPESQGLQNILSELIKEIASLKNLPSQINTLKLQIDTLQSAPSTEYRNANEVPLIPSSENMTPNSKPLSPPEQSPIRLKDIADSIPKFDGQKMSVFQFSKICERALDLIPSHHEPYLVQLILSKLQGHAYTVIEGSVYDNVNQLLRKLKQIFGPNKSLNQYKGELGNAYMRHNETIFDYIARIKELRTAIIDIENEMNIHLDRWIIDTIDQDCLDSFINGLPSELLIRVKIEGYTSLDDAFTKAIQLSKTLEIENIRRKSSFPTKQPPPPRQDTPTQVPRPNPNISPPINPSPRSILQRPQEPFIKPLIPGQPGPNAPLSNSCRYCKQAGHLIDNCQKLAYKRNLESRESATVDKNAVRPENFSGNANRIPVPNDVRRDAEPIGRPMQKTVQFRNTPTAISESPN